MKTVNIKHTAKSCALLKQCVKTAPLTSSGSGDSTGLPEQKPNIAEGKATWF
jgi:hypothetical protein